MGGTGYSTNLRGAGSGAKAPCGTDSTARGAVAATYTPGETVTVKWDMGAPHAGDCMVKIVSGPNPTSAQFEAAGTLEGKLSYLEGNLSHFRG